MLVKEHIAQFKYMYICALDTSQQTNDRSIDRYTDEKRINDAGGRKRQSIGEKAIQNKF